jgi:GT2 family glycosyltransferase
LRASIVIVGYNSREALKGCLDSLHNAGLQDAEVLLVDNSSQDGTAEWARAAHPEARVIRSETNLGFGGGCNLGAGQARGEYLAFLNPDTTVEPGWLEALIEALEQNPWAGLATSRIVLINDPQRINTCGNEVHVSGLTLCRGMGASRAAYNRPEAVAAVSGAAFALRRALFEQLGGFDAGCFLYMEDTDLSLRARLAGYGCLYVPGSVVHHDYQLTFGPRKVYYQERNRYRMLLKVYRGRTLLALLPALLLAELAAWGFVLLRDRRPGNKLAAYAWVLRHRNEIRQQRRHVQSMRRVSDRELLSACTYRLAFEQTGDGAISRLAHLALDPLFYLLKNAALVGLR